MSGSSTTLQPLRRIVLFVFIAAPTGAGMVTTQSWRKCKPDSAAANARQEVLGRGSCPAYFHELRSVSAPSITDLP